MTRPTGTAPLDTLLLPSLDDATGAAFDRFAAASPFAAYQQTRAWAEVAPAGASRFLFFLCRRGNEPVGAAVIRRTRLSPWHWLATIQRGPLVHDPEMLGPVLAALGGALARAGCCSAQLAPRVRGRPLPMMAEALRQARYVMLSEARQPLHSTTGIVWLDKPEGDILASFKQRGRRQLKAAAKAGITVRPAAGEADIAAYQRVLDAFRAARPGYDMSGLPTAAGQAALIARLGGGMLLAEQDGAVCGGHAFVRQGDEAIWLSLATLDQPAAAPRAYPLLWEGIRAARALGCVGYDLAGLPAADPRDVGEANRAQFKAAFAPMRRVMPPMHVAAIRPLPHLMLFALRQLYRRARLRRFAPATPRADVA